MAAPKELYKTTIVIWSEYSGEEVELSDLAYEAEVGVAYCSKQESVKVTDWENDPDAPSLEFFAPDWSLDDDEEKD